ncbi:unnamed protein product [Peniophora sp. CBMAI 1063]|nr:unnamed protein product [Peniophora sp. CBMAI 1063]
MHFIDLPFDILERILCCLDVRDVLVCSSVCKLLQQTINESLPLRYAIALAERGMTDGTDSFASLAERLENLERYELAWRELRWQETLRFDLPAPSRYVYQEDGYLLIVDPAMCTVKVVRLPSPLRGVPQAEHNWSAPPAFLEGDGTVLIDVRLDLVVFLNHQNTAGATGTGVQARTLSTGEIHPLADARATCFIPRSPDSLNQVHRHSDQSMCLRGRHILWGDSAQGRIGYNHINCPRLFDWTNGRDVTPRLNGSVTCALTFLHDGRVIAIVFNATSAAYELWLADPERPGSEGRASVTHMLAALVPPALESARRAVCIRRQSRPAECEVRAVLLRP